MEHNLKYFILPLGCQMNSSDTERITTVLEGMGFQKTDKEEEADLMGIIACSVRQKAIDRVYGKIHRWNRWKNKKSLITFVSGCILPADEKKFLKLFDLVFKIDDLPRLPEIFNQYGMVTPIRGIERRRAGIRKDFENHFWNIQPTYSSPYQAYVPIQNGCNKFCAFCAVPYTRGREVSRPSQDILKEIDTLVAQGYKSITLLGQNVNSYGLDKNGKEKTFVELLKDIGEFSRHVKKDFWVYFTSPHPADMSRDVFALMAKYPCFAKQVHLPIQSGSDEILKKMSRSYTLEDYRSIVCDIRNILPQATLFTDIIVGFTGESEAHFESTRRAMYEFGYNMAYISYYSPRPGAVSSRWADDVSHKVKKERFRILTDDLASVALKYNQKYIGQTLRALIDGKDDKEGFFTGRTEGRIPIQIPIVSQPVMGKFVDVKITSVVPFSISGKFVRLSKVPAEEPAHVR